MRSASSPSRRLRRTGLAWALGLAMACGCAVAMGATAPGGDGAASVVPRETRHALIIGVGEYADPNVPPLKGVVHDVTSARAMAQAMGIPEGNTLVLRDRQATAERIRTEIRRLAARVAPGDRVFVYYSGHGTRWLDTAIQPNACTEGLLASDSGVLSNVEMATLLKQVSDKTDKLFVFYDACYSGGIAGMPLRTRSLQRARETLTPKFTPAGVPEMCAKPSNFRTRSLALVMQAKGVWSSNVAHVAASRPDEVAFDSSETGGVATVAWRDCMLGQARDTDGSGAITVDEVAQCAQARIDQQLLNAADISGQHLVLGGNPSYVPAWQRLPAAPSAGPGTAVAATEAVVPAPAPASAAARLASPAQLLAEVHGQRDGGRFVEARMRSSQLRIQRDALELSVTSLRSGYLYIALAGSDQKSLYLIYPNDLDADNRIRAGQMLRLPRPNWEITAQGPAGRDTLLVLVTDTPRDLSSLAAEKAGPFMKSLLDAEGRSSFQRLLVDGTPGARCSPGAGTAKTCSDAFGSALLTVDEVP